MSSRTTRGREEGRRRGTWHDGSVPPFEPFTGIRYAPDLDLADVTAPPYDVIDADDRAALVARSDRNAVLFDLPLESDGERPLHPRRRGLRRLAGRRHPGHRSPSRPSPSTG